MSDSIDYKTKYLIYKTKYINLKNNKQKGGGNNTNNTNNNINSNNINVMLFKGDYCGHCKKFLPTWNALKSTLGNSKYNFITYDSEKDKSLFDKYKVNGVPSIFVQKGDYKEQYDGPRDLQSLIQYLS